METLKEYAGVITAVVSVVAALGALGLWAKARSRPSATTSRPFS